MRRRTVLLGTHALLLGTLVAVAALPAVRGSRDASSAQAVAFAATSGAAPDPHTDSSSGQTSYASSIKPLVTQYCAGCHSGDKAPGGVNFAKYSSNTSVIDDSAVWEKAAENLSSLKMPPDGMPAPTQGERAQMVAWIQATLSQAGCRVSDPGRVTLRRLNRQEYDNTVDDLLHVNLHPADEFPGDDVGYGFDNNGDVLSLSPLLLEKYLSAAETLAHAAILAPESLGQTTHLAMGDMRFVSNGQAPPVAAGGYELYSNDEISAPANFPVAGDYILHVRAYGQQAGPDRCRMSLRFNHGALGADVTVAQVEAKPGVFSATVHVEKAGEFPVGAAFTNDYYKADDPDPNNRDRNLVVCSVAVQGPMSLPKVKPESERMLLARYPATRAQFRACAKADLAPFASRAFRRPVTTHELDRLMDCFEEGASSGASFERGMQVAVEATLLSPSFLYRTELDPRVASGKDGNHPLSSYEMASRLSYFLWSSMPDDTLLSLAAQGKLQDPDVLKAQVARMLKSPKSQALATDFADQWLELRKLNVIQPDLSQFPQYDAKLRDSMRTESEMYFQNIVAQDRSIIEFLDSDYTFLNAPLAQLYGVPNITGDNFRRVALTDRNRGGVLTQASVLTVTSNPTRTSPVKRGKWVLVELLGTPPPPPPPGVPQLADATNSHGPLTGSLRDRMIQHRADPACATCHKSMDPLGFGLENFNAIGQWRTQDSGETIDASGVLPNGGKFNGPAELKAYLLTRKDQFNRAFAEKMLTFALGRGMTSGDRCNVDKIAAGVKANGYRFSSLVDAVVLSTPFRERHADQKPVNTREATTIQIKEVPRA